MKNLIIGLGTGRCGTTSLARLLALQPDSSFVHEGGFPKNKYSHFLLPWNVDLSKLIEWEKKIKELSGDRNFSGDVGSYFIQYVLAILQKYPNAKFLCLKREKEQVVQSFIKRTRGRNHWMERIPWYQARDIIWDKIFPRFNVSNKKEAIALYWDIYYLTAFDFEKRFPENFRIFPTEFLNSISGMNEILDFAGIPASGRVLEKKHENKNTIKDELSSMTLILKNFFKDKSL